MAYGFVYSITIDETLCGSADSTNFPILFAGIYDGTGGEPDLRVTGSGGDVTSSSGFDIIFAANPDGTSPYDFEIERYIGATGEVAFWVRIPTLSASTNTTLYVLFGDAGVTTFQGNVNGTWNSNYRMVCHYPDGSSLTVLDSTSNGANGSVTGGVAAAAGKVDGGGDFNGSTGYVDSSGYSSNTSSGSFECWIRPDANGGVFIADGAGLGAPYFYLHTDSTLHADCAVLNNPAKTNETVSNGAWTHVVATFTAGANKIYINGVEATYSDAGGSGGYANGFSGIRVGAWYNASLFFDGKIDEVRISNSVRSSSWVAASYNNQNDPATFYALASVSGVNLNPAAGAIALTGATPTVAVAISAEPVAASIVLTGGTPVVTLVGFNLTPASGTITITGGTPVINFTILRPDPGVIAFLGGQPGVSLSQTVASGSALYFGTTRYEWREESPAQISKALSSAWSAEFSLRWFNATKPIPGTEVAFFWDSVKRFGGVALSCSETAIKGNFAESILTVRCTGFQSYTDRTIVAKLYTIPIGGVPSIITFDLWEEHLAQFGVTIVHPQGQAISIAVQLFHYITVTEALNRLKDLQPGYDWQIDDNKAFTWRNTAGGSGPAAPFTLRNNDRNVDTMSTTGSNARFRNSQWVLPSVDLAALRTDSHTATAGQTSFRTVYALGVEPIVKLNGTVQAVTVLGTWDGSPWYYIPDGNGVFRTPGSPAISGGDAVTVTYPNPFPLGFNVKDQASIDAVGLYEAVYQAKDAVSESDCLQLAAGLLQLYGTNGDFPESLTFTYNSQQQAAWLVPAMALDVDRTFPKALGMYTVESVTSTLERLSVWRHSVKCRINDGAVTDQLIEQAIYRTAGRVWVNVPPILATMEIGVDTTPFVLGVQWNTYRFRGSGVILSWDARTMNNPPTGAAFICDLLLNGSSIFPAGNPNKINIPAGATAEQNGIRFVSDNLAYSDGDILTMNIIQVGSIYPGSNGLVHLNLKPNTALPPA